MNWILGGLSILGATGWMAFALIALRFSGLKNDRNKADLARLEQADELKEASERIADYKTRMVARIKDLEDEIEGLEDELDLCSTPGARRNTLNRLLQAASGARRDAQDGMS